MTVNQLFVIMSLPYLVAISRLFSFESDRMHLMAA